MKRGMAIIVALAVMLPALSALGQTSENPTNIYAAGMSYNPGAKPSVSGTGLYARNLLDKTGTYAFTAVDVLPATAHPLTVTTNFSVGVAQKVLTIGKITIYAPTSAGLSYNGSNTGWAWTTGALLSIPVKGRLRIMPHVRLIKSSVNNNAGYQPVGGLLFGWGQ